MEHYDIYATLDIHVIGDASSPEEALSNAIAEAKYEIIGSRLQDAPPTTYISTSEYAKRHGLSYSTYIRTLCRTGVIPGAIKIGRTWCVPENTPHIDRRLISDGKYAGWYDKYGRAKYQRDKAAREAAKANDAEPQNT